MLEHVDTVLSFAVVMLLLSLLVTTIVQIAVTALSLRSKILKMGIERLLKQVAPDLNDYAANIANAVVCHPAVGAKKSCPAAILEKLWRRVTGRQTATAQEPCTTDIKKEELIRLLDDLATSPTSKLDENAKRALKQVMGVAVLPEVKTLADRVQAELIKAFSADAEVAKIKRIVEYATESSRRATADVTTWFDTVIDRTTDEFRQRTRWITIGCAVVLPLVFHVDSLQIFRQLTSNPELRTKLVQMADGALDKAAQSLSLAEGSASLASTALQQACTDCPALATAYALRNVPGGLATRTQGVAWLDVKFSEPKDPNHPKMFLAKYHEHFDEIAATQLQGLAQCAKEIKTTLDESKLTIFEIPDTSEDFWKHYWGWWDGRHFWGTLVTAVFLSLGAPFWYNTLKQLSNLRPAIAQKVDQASQPKE